MLKKTDFKIGKYSYGETFQSLNKTEKFRQLFRIISGTHSLGFSHLYQLVHVLVGIADAKKEKIN